MACFPGPFVGAALGQASLGFISFVFADGACQFDGLVKAMPERSHSGSNHETDAADALTARQQEIAQCVAEGLSNAEIAERLTLTPGTVANHVGQILRRLNLAGRVQLAVWAVECGLYRSERNEE